MSLENENSNSNKYWEKEVSTVVRARRIGRESSSIKYVTVNNAIQNSRTVVSKYLDQVPPHQAENSMLRDRSIPNQQTNFKKINCKIHMHWYFPELPVVADVPCKNAESSWKLLWWFQVGLHAYA